MSTNTKPWEFDLFENLTPESKIKAITEIRKDHDDELSPEASDSEVIALINKYDMLFYIDGYRC